jgi:hypothetical protein
VKFRVPTSTTDIALTVKTNQSVHSVKEKLSSAAGSEKGTNPDVMRLFYNGREMKDDSLLGHYDVEDGIVIQVYHRGKPIAAA